MPTEPTFTPGDRVSYVYSTKTGASFTATILQIWPDASRALLDLDDNAGLIWRPLETLTHI